MFDAISQENSNFSMAYSNVSISEIISKVQIDFQILLGELLATQKRLYLLEIHYIVIYNSVNNFKITTFIFYELLFL